MNLIKILKKLSFIVIILFIIYNIFWFSWVNFKYSKYTEDIPKQKYGLKLRAIKDNEGFLYYVKKPDYLSFTGNLSITMPNKTNDEIQFNDTIIIWCNPFNNSYAFGVLIYDSSNNLETVQYQIYIDENGNAIDLDTNSIMITEKHKDNINILLKKADDMWNIKNKS